jgi:hypothetical protein
MSKFALNYHKTKRIVLEDLEKQWVSLLGESAIYQPFDIEGLQCYNPIYNTFFEMNDKNFDTIAFNHRHHMVDLLHIWDIQTSQKVECELFIKFAPLLDPVRYLIGRYKSQEGIKVLPTHENKSHEKIKNPNNASYIDNFFCYLSSQLLNHHDFKHSIDYYGSFLGIQRKFKMNLADDMDYLIQSDFFNQQKGKLYEIENKDADPFANFGSRNNKNKLLIHNASNDTVLSLDELHVSVEEVVDEIIIENVENNECIYEKSSNSDESSVDSSNNSEVNYSEDDSDEEEEDSEEEDSEDDEDEEDSEEEDSEDDEDEDDEDEDDEDEDEEDDEIPMNGFIYDFPVQMICLEKCTGTLDQLFAKRKLDLDKAASAIFQVIITLLAYQRAYYFTHNDLHTNNIMYVETDIEFLYYKVNGRLYKVPTYGKIFKIIDFGRAIYRFQGKTFCSDSFAPGGDAATQYNFEPYFNEKKPRLDPNYSFDLCRLGCSIYDFILEIDDELSDNFKPDMLQKLIIDWVRDDNGKNVLYKKNGDERYPNFKLYKMIARTVHNKTPELQLNNPFFSNFCILTGVLPTGDIIDIDTLPCYAI